MPAPALKVLAFNCSLKSAGGKEKSSTDILLQQLLDALATHGAKGDIIRAVDHDIKPGVKSDEGEGDAWPLLRKRVVEADILIIGTPIWLGQPSSVAKRVLERMDAFLEETDARGRMPSYGKVALAVVVGNEDGAHHTAAELFQALTEVGFTIPAGVLGRRGDGRQGIQGFLEDPESRGRMDTAAGVQCRAPRASAQEAKISGDQGRPVTLALV